MLPELMLPGQREDIEKENDEGALEKKHSFELRPAPVASTRAQLCSISVASTRAQLCGNFNFENILGRGNGHSAVHCDRDKPI